MKITKRHIQQLVINLLSESDVVRSSLKSNIQDAKPFVPTSGQDSNPFEHSVDATFVLSSNTMAARELSQIFVNPASTQKGDIGEAVSEKFLRDMIDLTGYSAANLNAIFNNEFSPFADLIVRTQDDANRITPSKKQILGTDIAGRIYDGTGFSVKFTEQVKDGRPAETTAAGSPAASAGKKLVISLLKSEGITQCKRNEFVGMKLGYVGMGLGRLKSDQEHLLNQYTPFEIILLEPGEDDHVLLLHNDIVSGDNNTDLPGAIDYAASLMSSADQAFSALSGLPAGCSVVMKPNIESLSGNKPRSYVLRIPFSEGSAPSLMDLSGKKVSLSTGINIVFSEVESSTSVYVRLPGFGSSGVVGSLFKTPKGLSPLISPEFQVSINQEKLAYYGNTSNKRNSLLKSVNASANAINSLSTILSSSSFINDVKNLFSSLEIPDDIQQILNSFESVRFDFSNLEAQALAQIDDAEDAVNIDQNNFTLISPNGMVIPDSTTTYATIKQFYTPSGRIKRVGVLVDRPMMSKEREARAVGASTQGVVDAIIERYEEFLSREIRIRQLLNGLSPEDRAIFEMFVIKTDEAIENLLAQDEQQRKQSVSSLLSALKSTGLISENTTIDLTAINKFDTESLMGILEVFEGLIFLYDQVIEDIVSGDPQVAKNRVLRFLNMHGANDLSQDSEDDVITLSDYLEPQEDEEELINPQLLTPPDLQFSRVAESRMYESIIKELIKLTK